MLIEHKLATVLGTCACVACRVHMCIEVAKVAIHIAFVYCPCVCFHLSGSDNDTQTQQALLQNVKVFHPALAKNTTLAILGDLHFLLICNIIPQTLVVVLKLEWHK